MKKVKIAANYIQQPLWKIVIAVPLIYLPLFILVPFLLVGVIVIRLHLTLMGTTNLKSYWDFVPTWISHRYQYKTQIVDSQASWISLCRYKWFWIFNCKLYCPLSVALFEYGSYLVKIVENWWCPFYHDKKNQYANSTIDQSVWHIYPKSKAQLHEQDCNNPIWNEEVIKSESAENS